MVGQNYNKTPPAYIHVYMHTCIHTYNVHTFVNRQYLSWCVFMGGHHCKKWSHEAVRLCFVSIKHSVDIHKLDANYSLQVWKKKWKFAQKCCCIHAQLIFHPLREKQNVVITFKVVVSVAKNKSRILFEKFLDLTELMRLNHKADFISNYHQSRIFKTG